MLPVTVPSWKAWRKRNGRSWELLLVSAGEWRERGGPPVVAPKRQGFGTRFVEGSVASELQGDARIQYERDGLICTMQIPVDLIVVDLDVAAHD